MFNNIQKAIVLSAAIVAGGFFQSASADWSSNNGGNSAGVPHDIVISLKSNPMANLEEACLAVTFARMLSGKPGHNVTLFVTLDGVALAADLKAAKKRICTTPESQGGEISLAEHLEEFLGGDNHSNDMVVCPICWNERYPGEAPKYGVVPVSPGETPDEEWESPPSTIPGLMGNADKILDF